MRTLPRLATRPRDVEPQPDERRDHDPQTLLEMLTATAARLRNVELPRLRYPKDKRECRLMIHQCRAWARELQEQHQLRMPRRRAG